MNIIGAVLLLKIFLFAGALGVQAQNNALKLNGSNQFVSADGVSSTLAALGGQYAFSMEAWINPSSYGVKSFFLSFHTPAVNNNVNVLLLGFDGTGKIQLGYNNGSDVTKLSSSPVIPLNQWTHVAITIANDNYTTVYINGKIDFTWIIPVRPVTDGRFSIGQDWDGTSVTDVFNGYIDEVRIWSDVRTQAEIQSNMFKELAGTEGALTAYYKMNEGNGVSLTDNSSNLNTGTLVGSPTWKASGAFAGPRNALDFDGIDDYIALSNGVVLGTQFTQEMWIYPTDETVSYRGILGKNYGGSESHLRPPCVYQYGKKIHFGFGDGTNWNGFETTNDVFTINAWNHIAVAFNGTTYQVYVNGKLETSVNFASTPNLVPQDRIGGMDNNFQGKIDEVRIWNIVRSATEIRETMFRNLSGDEAGLMGYYRMEQAGGTILYDHSTYGRNGTLTNMDDNDWVDSGAFNTWLGVESNVWSTVTNWSDGIPTSTDNVGIYKTDLGNEASIGGSPNVDNLMISSTANPTLSSGMTVNGNLILENNVNLNGQTVTLGNSATLIEDAGIFYGTSGVITTTRNLSNIFSEDVGGLGAVVTTTADMGSTAITRGHANQFWGGHNSVLRYYDITPTTNTGLNATLTFNYYDSELNNLTEANLKLFRSADEGVTFSYAGGTVSAGNNSITLASLDGFSRWMTAEAILPTVTTQAGTDILTTSATGNGTIEEVGAPDIIQYGICWNTTGIPTINDNKTEEGTTSTTGNFTSAITGLTSETTCFVRTYATNAAGTSYGGVQSFTSLKEVATDISVIPSTIAENQAVGTTVGTLSAIPSSGIYSYSLFTGEGDTDNSSFSIKVNSIEDQNSGLGETGIGIFSGYDIWQSFTAGSSGPLSKIALRTTSGGTSTYTLKLKVFEGEGISGLFLGEATAVMAPETNSYIYWNFSGITVEEGHQYTFQLTEWTFYNGYGLYAWRDDLHYTGGKMNYSGYPGYELAFKTFVATSTDLIAESSFDYESKSSYTTRIKAINLVGNSYEEALTISISNVNETPANIALSSNSVNENVVTNSTIGNLSTTDPDAGNTFAYSLVSGVGSADNTSFNINGSSLRITNSPDFEAKSSYSVRIRTTDQGGLFYEKVFTININNLDDEAPKIGRNVGLNLNEGATKGITLSQLEANDADTDNTTLTYTISTLPTNGWLEYSTNPGVSISSFTQQQLMDGKISYVHDDSNTTSDSFGFKVSDGTPNELTGQTFNITVNAIDDDTPAITTNTGLTLNEGTTKTVTISELEANDTDTGNATLTYTITTLPINGWLEYSANQGVSISSFTQQQLMDGEISYVHDDSNTTSDSFGFKVSDGTPNELTGQTFNITVNAIDDDTPTIVTNTGLTLNEGTTKTVTISELEANDTDTDNATLTYTITTLPTNGWLEYSANPGESISSFTQQQLMDGKISYLHDDSNTTSDSFTFKVADAVPNELTGQTFAISVTPVDDDSPTIVTNNGLRLDEGASAVIPVDSLESDDTEANNFALVYIVTTFPINGRLENSDNQGISISLFTQQQLMDGKISYVHNDSNTTSDSFIFKVSDGANNELTGQSFNITVNPINDDPPAVTTNAAADVAITTATIGGNITNDYGISIIERGVVYSIKSVNNNPEIGGAGVMKDINSSDTNLFSESVGPLLPNTTYTFQAYATNIVGTSYGGVIDFTTAYDNIAPEINCNAQDIFLDEDGSHILGTSEIKAFAVGTTDNVDDFEDLEVSVSRRGFNCSQVGEVLQAKVTVTDKAGNESFCWADVTVHYPILYKIAPVDDIEVEIDEGECGTKITYPDFENNSCASFAQLSGIGPDSIFPIGTTTEKWELTDMNGISDTISFDVIVTVVNSVPTLDIISEVEAEEDAEIDVQLGGISYGNDCEAQDLLITATSSNTDLVETVNVSYAQGDSIGTLSIVLADGASGTAQIEVYIEDSEGGIISRTFNLTVTAVNNSPHVVNPVADQFVNASFVLKVPISSVPGELFIDSDNSSFTLDITRDGTDTLPSWAVYEDDTLYCTPMIADTGCVNIVVQATDPDGAIATDTFRICVGGYPLNIDDIEAEVFDVQMYPNPTKGIVNLDINTIEIHDTELSVMDVTGSVVLKKQFSAAQTIWFDMSGKVSGIYFVHLNFGDKHAIRKLIIDRK